MKRLFYLLLMVVAFTEIRAQALSERILYETIADAEEKKLLKGFIRKEDITRDSVFAWYARNLKYAGPNREYVELIRGKVSDFQILLFLGTWCHDSQQILPKYFALLDAAGFPEQNLTLIACDRQKTTILDLQRPFMVKNVPTLILFKDGKEVGRIVEYGNLGMVDKELANLIQSH